MKRQLSIVRVCLFAVLIPLVCLLAVPALGIRLTEGLAVALTAAGGGALLFVLLLNFILLCRTRKRMLSVSMREVREEGLARREQIVRDPEPVEARIRRRMRLLRLLNVCVILFWATFACGVCGLCAPAFPKADAYLIAFLTTSGLFCLIAFAPLLALTPHGSAEPQETGIPLSREAYPLFYAVADRAATEAGYGGKYVLVYALGGETVSVAERDGMCYVALPPVPTRLLTEEELLTVLKHEFAHVSFRDTAWSKRLETFKRQYLPEGRRALGFFQNLWFYGYALPIGLEADLFTQYQSRAREEAADAVAQDGRTESFASALFKLELLAAYFRVPRGAVTHAIYAQEQPPEDFYKQIFTLFEGGMSAFRAQKEAVLLRTLPARSDTHPALKERLAACGVSEVGPLRLPEGDYRDEAEAFLLDCGRLRANGWDWESAHAAYLARSERLSRPEGHTKEQLLLDCYEAEDARLRPLADDLLAARDSLFAKFLKGAYLAGQDEAEGLPLLEEVARESPYFGLAAYELYGNAVLRTGDEQLLERVREEQAPLFQRQADVVRDIFYKLPNMQGAKGRRHLARLTACDLPEEQLRAMREAIDGVAAEAYLMRLPKRDGAELFFVFLVPVREAAFEEAALFFKGMSRIRGPIFFPVFEKAVPEIVKQRGVKI